MVLFWELSAAPRAPEFGKASMSAEESTTKRNGRSTGSATGLDGLDGLDGGKGALLRAQGNPLPLLPKPPQGAYPGAECLGGGIG
jgi:hypothetical protein